MLSSSCRTDSIESVDQITQYQCAAHARQPILTSPLSPSWTPELILRRCSRRRCGSVLLETYRAPVHSRPRPPRPPGACAGGHRSLRGDHLSGDEIPEESDVVHAGVVPAHRHRASTGSPCQLVIGTPDRRRGPGHTAPMAPLHGLRRFTFRSTSGHGGVTTDSYASPEADQAGCTAIPRGAPHR